MKKTVLGSLVVAFVAVLSMGSLSLSCSSPDPIGVSTSTDTNVGTSGGGGGGTTSRLTVVQSNGGASGTSAGEGGSPATPASPDGNCGISTNDTKRAEADILIVLDRSESMTNSMSADTACSIRDSSCTTRLAAVVAGVKAIVSANPGIRWGLELFSNPDGASCSVASKPEVAISADSSSAILSRLDTLTTQASTPTRLAITAATTYLNTVTDGNNRVILLATDGLPNCGSDTSGKTTSDDMVGTTAAVTAAKSANIPVYVIGIGPTASVSNLNTLAEAGGTGSYYSATSPTELSTALSSIAKVVSATCTFKAHTKPDDSSLVYVYVDGKLVDKDDSNGWEFDTTDSTSSTVVLTGSHCTDMMAGTTSQVQIVFGCAGTSPPKVIY